MSEPAASASGRRLLNATAVMASGTMISKVLGFVKASLLVIVLGANSPQGDAYSLATLVPNTLYMIFAGGALNTVLVPQIVRHIRTDDDRGEAFVNRVMTAFLVVLAVVTAVAMVFTPQVMSLWTADTWRSPAFQTHWSKLVLLALVTMPQLFFYGAFFLVGQVLNARDRFGPMMWAPILNNVVGIAVLGLYAWVWGTDIDHQVPFTTDQVLLLGLGSTAGIVLQTVALLPAMRSIGFRYRPRWDLKGQGLGDTFHLAKWMLGYVLLTTVAQTVVQRLASGATVSGTPGAGVAAYNTAYLVWILPHSLLTVSLATAMLPSASRLAAAHDLPGVAAETTRTMRLANTFAVPATAGFLVLGHTFSRLAFGHGAGADSWQFIAWTLVCLAAGLVPYTIQYVSLRGFYALEDTRTPFLIQIAISGANVALALGLVALNPDPLTIAPRLGLAYALSYTLGAWLTHRALRSRLPGLVGRDLLRHVLLLVVATVPGALAAAAITWGFAGERSVLVVLVGFLFAAGVAVVGFFFVAKRLGVAETTQLVAVLRRRGGGDPDADPGADGPGGDGPASTGPAPDGASPDTTPRSTTAPRLGVRADRPLLSYPDPGEPGDPVTDIPHGTDDVAEVRAGQVLDGRYRLDEILARRGGTLTWRGLDLALGRPVLLHVMSPREHRTLEILDQARLSAPAVDSHFLRVWDAVLVEDQPHGSYIVCEYAAGQSLELALRTGALSPVEAAWLVREVADGLAGMHAQGLYHRQLNPDTVVITATGNVKIVGFLVEAALHPEPDDDTDGEVQDVRALGELFYAALLGLWPSGAAYGLPAAPRDARGRPLLPRQVRAGVPTVLNDIVDRILSPVPQGRASRLVTAADVATALSSILGTTNASADLERRLHIPVTPVGLTPYTPPTVRAIPAAAAPTASVSAAVSAGPVLPGGAGQDDLDEEPGGDLADDLLESTEAFAPGPGDNDRTAPFTPIPPPTKAGPVRQLERQGPPDPPRGWYYALLGAFVLVLVVGLVGVFVGQFQRSRSVPEPAWHVAASARDFDPAGDGGDNRENADLAPLVIDGDPDTAWTTERYGRSGDFNGRKPGAGVIVDLGETREVGRVRVLFGPGAHHAEVRVPVDATATTPPLKAADDWRVVATLADASGDVTTPLNAQVRTRFVLVYLIGLPKAGANFQGTIAEVQTAP